LRCLVRRWGVRWDVALKSPWALGDPIGKHGLEIEVGREVVMLEDLTGHGRPRRITAHHQLMNGRPLVGVPVRGDHWVHHHVKGDGAAKITRRLLEGLEEGCMCWQQRTEQMSERKQ